MTSMERAVGGSVKVVNDVAMVLLDSEDKAGRGRSKADHRDEQLIGACGAPWS